MPAVKCLKINSAIKDPSTEKDVTGICVTIKSQESAGTTKDGDDNAVNNFNTINNYYYSESALDAKLDPLNWQAGLSYRVNISCSDEELAGEGTAPKYANQLFYDKLKIALEALGYTDIEEIYYS